MSGPARAGDESQDILAHLAKTIAARRGADPEQSHTAAMLARGPAKCAEKFGEEAVEAIIEAVRGDGRALTCEAADVLYHLLVLLEAARIPFEDVLQELARRSGISGIAEKAARQGGEIRISQARDAQEIALCLAIRKAVFVVEQNVPLAMENDGHDAAARHYLARRGGRALATARVRLGETTAKIERVAVEKTARGTGIGKALMRHILDDLQKLATLNRIELAAQTHSYAFYQNLGFRPEGEEFDEAGIPHQRMVMVLG